MFNNSVTLVSDMGESAESVIAVDPISGKTVRSFSDLDGLTGSLTIAHSSSNENPGLATQRSNVRITALKEIEDTGKFANGYVQWTGSFPKGVFTAAEIQKLTSALVNFIVNAENASAVNTVQSADLLAVPRLYAGEP